jgi:hypothetical protein
MQLLLLFEPGDSVRKSATVMLFVLLLAGMVGFQYVDHTILGLAPGDFWMLSGLGLLLIRFICLNYAFNAALLRNSKAAALCPKNKWFLIASRKALPELDEVSGIAIIRWPGVVALLVAAFGFFPSMYLAIAPEQDHVHISSYILFLIGIGFFLANFAVVFIKGKTLRPQQPSTHSE